MEKYLLGQIDGTEYGVKTETPKQKINFVFDTYEKEHNYPQNKQRTPNHQQRFSEWLAGLPTVISLPYTNHKILELAKELQEIKTELPKATEESIVKNYFSFMSYHIHKLKDKHN